jgi:hypothetical protein
MILVNHKKGVGAVEAHEISGPMPTEEYDSGIDD